MAKKAEIPGQRDHPAQNSTKLSQGLPAFGPPKAGPMVAVSEAPIEDKVSALSRQVKMMGSSNKKMMKEMNANDKRCYGSRYMDLKG